ncbi:MAG: Fe-S cluster protein, partial [Odoribacter sp.]|nr:Fe-S cluster protein [Odoribacter sp.]
ETIYEVSPGLRGMEFEKICPFSEIFHAALTTGEEITEKLFRENDKIWLISIYNIQPHRLVFGLIQDFRESYGQNEWMMQKTEEVIRKNMETVRQIAFLLGENAAYTDATLTALKEILKTAK